jgi:ParB-like chromosome segregation protein Spo0J
MEIIEKKLNELTPYEKNPRKNDDAVKYVAASIEQFGFKVPVVIDAAGVIVAGHTRYKAAKRLGLESVPCIVADDLNEEQIRAFRLADNKVGEVAEWDIDLLGEELEEIFNLDMSDFGFKLDLDDEEPAGNFEESDFNYSEQYGVTVILPDEVEQEKCYNLLVEMGYECKVVTV